MQCTIEKPYKMVTKNDRKILKFSTFVRFLGPFLKKRCFSKIGNFERDEKFWMKLSAKFLHKVLWKMNTKWVGMTPIWYLLHPFFKNTAFSKIALKPNKSRKFQKFSVILGNHFIGLFNGILHVFMFCVIANKQWDFDLGYILICHRL